MYLHVATSDGLVDFGTRLIILHAGFEKGWIRNVDLVFQSKKNTGDYHNKMNSERLMGIIHTYIMLYTNRFEEWFKDALLPNIDPNSLIVIDNASYHSRREE